MNLLKVDQKLEDCVLARFFMILGGPRSGTTLLAQCLSAHSKNIVPYETDVIVPCAFIVDRVGDSKTGKRLITDLITHSYYFDVSLGKYLTSEEVRRSVERSDYAIQSIFLSLYSLLGEKAGKPIAGDKSPGDLFNVLILSRTGMLNQPTKIVHLVRDVRDVMVSLNRLDWFPKADSYFPRLWASRNLFLQTHMQNAPNYSLIRYEDFVTEPVRWLTTLSDFLGVEFERQMLDTTSFPSFYKTVPAHSHLHDRIGPQHIGEWKVQATVEQIRMYESQAREAMLKFGYLNQREMVDSL